MTAQPWVSVITPTWQRHGLLLTRCIPSVQAQTYAPIEQIVVSDGPDPVLSDLLADEPVTYAELGEWQGRQWGARARRRGLDLAQGEIICYLDDDDSYRPDHVAVLVKALTDNPDAGFAYSLMASHNGEDVTIIGSDEPLAGQIGTPMIAHRRQLLEQGTWGPPSAWEDWQMVARWLEAGTRWVHVDEVTVDVWPSAHR
jgi:hypothetical protein